ncbi:MAG: peptidoglycan-binding protein [Patescibacteria group bacterium]
MKLNPSNIRFIVILLVLYVCAIGTSANADTPPSIPDNKGVKSAIQELFADAPQMISIAQCESGFRQYTAKGTTFTGSGGQYVGVFQISKGHTSNAKKMGFDIYTLEGNLGFAKYLYNKQGVQPWRGCVKTAPTSKTKTALLTKSMGIGTNHPEVMTLQKILNSAGFFVARSGPGSPNNETTVFDSKTLDALKRFQCIHNIACRGTADTTGYGYVGPLTRAALLKAAKEQGL